MSHLDFETERIDNESETNSVTSDELIISSYYLEFRLLSKIILLSLFKLAN